MSVRDHISEFLTKLRNAGMAKLRFTEIRVTKSVLELVKILKEEGFIEGYLVREEKPQDLARIYLKYDQQRKPIIQGLRRLSSCSCRRYVGYRDIPEVFGGMGISILSTSQGVMVGNRAREKKVGGEVLCYVW